MNRKKDLYLLSEMYAKVNEGMRVVEAPAQGDASAVNMEPGGVLEIQPDGQHPDAPAKDESSENMQGDEQDLIDRLEEKGETFTSNETQQTINNIAQKCHTLLTGGGAGSEFSGIKLKPNQREVIFQIGQLILKI